MERWIRTLTVAGVSYDVHFSRRPFREGCTVECVVQGEVLRLAELGFGEVDALERVREAIVARLEAASSPAATPDVHISSKGVLNGAQGDQE